MTELSIPLILKAIADGTRATDVLAAWARRTRGDKRALFLELNENLTYLDLVARDGVELSTITYKLSTTTFDRLSCEGFNFNKLKRGKIPDLASLRGTDLTSWRRKTTAELVDSIYAKIRDLKIRYPHVAVNANYRWNVRVNNIRKRIWLLLWHVSKF
jgi:hypothetical protein